VIGGCSVFPTSNVWNTPVDRLPTVADPEASNYLATIGLGTGLHPDFGSGTWDGGNIGIPYDVVPQVQAFVPVDFALLGWDDESDAGPYLIPLDPQIEGEPTNAVGDRHVLVVHQEDCDLYEVHYAYPDGVDAAAVNDNYPDVLTCAAGTNGWCGASGAVVDQSSLIVDPDSGETPHLWSDGFERGGAALGFWSAVAP